MCVRGDRQRDVNLDKRVNSSDGGHPPVQRILGTTLKRHWTVFCRAVCDLYTSHTRTTDTSIHRSPSHLPFPSLPLPFHPPRAILSKWHIWHVSGAPPTKLFFWGALVDCGKLRISSLPGTPCPRGFRMPIPILFPFLPVPLYSSTPYCFPSIERVWCPDVICGDLYGALLKEQTLASVI